MPSFDKINAYVDLLCEQIRWKRAHLRVSEEMKSHILDSRDVYLEQGLDEESATEKAIADTGDATIIGLQFDRIHRPKTPWTMIGIIIFLLLFGLLANYFLYSGINGETVFFSRLLCSGIGLVAMFVAYFADFTILGKYPKIIYTLILVIAYQIILFSPIVNGRPLYAPYVILLFPLAYALIIFDTKGKGYRGIFLCGLAFIMPASIAIFSKFFSGFIQISIVGLLMLSMAIYKNWFQVKRLYGFLCVFVPTILASSVFLVSLGGFQRNRLLSLLDPMNVDSYLMLMIRDLLDGATLFGMGTIPAKYFPVEIPKGDSVFHVKDILFTQMSIMSDTDFLLLTTIVLFGWATFIVILAVLTLFVIIGLHLCFKQKSSLGFIVSIAILMTFCIQTCSYIAYNVGIHLISPISLPLISHGNTALLVNMILIGFMLSIFRNGDASMTEIRRYKQKS